MKSRIPFSARNWKRKNFGPLPSCRRLQAEEETDRDLQKSAQQLLCDVHEEILITLPYYQKIQQGQKLSREDYLICYSALLNSQKRIASLQMKNALNSGRTAIFAIIIAVISLFVSIFGILYSISAEKNPSSEAYDSKDTAHAPSEPFGFQTTPVANPIQEARQPDRRRTRRSRSTR